VRGIGFCVGVADGLILAVRVETTAVATTAVLLEALMLYKRWDLCFGSMNLVKTVWILSLFILVLLAKWFGYSPSPSLFGFYLVIWYLGLQR
jgi:hypothetical protein